VSEVNLGPLELDVRLVAFARNDFDLNLSLFLFGQLNSISINLSTGRESCAVDKAFATFGYDLCAPRWLFGDFGVQAFQLELEIAYAFEIPSLLPLLFVHIRRPGSASLYLFRIKRRREDAIVIYQLPIVAERLPRGGDSACCPRFSDLAAGASS
jgi:hypothetical protein